MSTSIFISYSPEDEAWARSFAEELQKRGLNPWFDLWNIGIGENVRESFEKGFRESSAIVFLLSSRRTPGPSLFFELGAAVGLNKKVISIVHGTPEAVDIPQPLRALRYIVEDSPSQAAEQVLRAVA